MFYISEIYIKLFCIHCFLNLFKWYLMATPTCSSEHLFKSADLFHQCVHLVILPLPCSWGWSWSPLWMTWGMSAGAWPTGFSRTLPSSSRTAATRPWTPTSLWASTPPPSSSRASRHTWCSTSCCTPRAATWGICAWSMQSGCRRQRRSTFAASSAPQRASAYHRRAP